MTFTPRAGRCGCAIMEAMARNESASRGGVSVGNSCSSTSASALHASASWAASGLKEEEEGLETVERTSVATREVARDRAWGV